MIEERRHVKKKLFRSSSPIHSADFILTILQFLAVTLCKLFATADTSCTHASRFPFFSLGKLECSRCISTRFCAPPGCIRGKRNTRLWTRSFATTEVERCREYCKKFHRNSRGLSLAGANSQSRFHPHLVHCHCESPFSQRVLSVNEKVTLSMPT